MKIKQMSLLAAFVFLFSLTSSQVSAQAPSSEIEIIFDASRSMLEPAGNTNKFEAGKQALVLIANQISPDNRVGFRAFGITPVTGNVKESCKDSRLLIPIGPFQKDALIARAMSLQANGNTPIGFSLLESAKDFTQGAQTKKTVILISDGAESCGVDPVGVMQTLKAQGIDIVVHTIGFGVDAAAAQQLKNIADVSGGTYADAKDAGELNKALTTVAEKAELLGPKKDVGENLLAASAGGRIESSSKEQYLQLIDGKEDPIGPLYIGEEAVFSFRDGQQVLLNSFAIPIFKQDNYNPQKISIAGSNESPNSGFFPILDIVVENKVMFGNVYQQFKIEPPVLVKYLKVTIGNCNTYCNIAELAVYGKFPTAQELAEQQKLAEAREINLLLAQNGGKMIASTDPKLSGLIDGATDNVDVQQNAEAIFGFKDGKTVTVSKIAIPIFEANAINIKKVEISVSETNPTSGYKTVGTFETTNLTFAENPYQEFAFDKPVKAKYVKVKFLTFQDEARTWGRMAELRILGTLKS